MDFTPEYIKQCEKAKEIQLLKGDRNRRQDWDSGDIYSFKGIIFTFESWAYSEGVVEEDIHTGLCIWLPRQDDLQKMVHTNVIARVLAPFIDWLRKSSPLRNPHSLSMEQLWLAFVMSELYQKHWTGEDWEANVKEEV